MKTLGGRYQYASEHSPTGPKGNNECRHWPDLSIKKRRGGGFFIDVGPGAEFRRESARQTENTKDNIQEETKVKTRNTIHIGSSKGR